MPAKRLCKEKIQQSEFTLEVGGWVQVSFGIFFKSSQNSSKPGLVFWSSIPCVLCLLHVVSYNDLSVLSMSVMGFHKKSLDRGRVGGVSSIQVYF